MDNTPRLAVFDLGRPVIDAERQQIVEKQSPDPVVGDFAYEGSGAAEFHQADDGVGGRAAGATMQRNPFQLGQNALLRDIVDQLHDPFVELQLLDELPAE